MNELKRTQQILSHYKYKSDKSLLRKQFPNKYTEEETLELLSKMYLFIKSKHFDIPKLRKTTLIPAPKGKSIPNSAQCSRKRKQIRFAHRILTRRADVTNVVGGDKWIILHGTLMLFELLTHEMSHFRIRGHRKNFYVRQTKLFNTALNGIISGEYYKQ